MSSSDLYQEYMFPPMEIHQNQVQNGYIHNSLNTGGGVGILPMRPQLSVLNMDPRQEILKKSQ